MIFFSVLITVLLSNSVAIVSTAKQKPLIVLPPAITWNSDNTIIVTPNPNAAYSSPVDIKGQVVNANDQSIKYHFGQNGVTAGKPVSLNVHVRDKSDLYTIYVFVTGHADFSIQIKGAPNVESVFLQSDKTFYRSNETIKIRALPLNPAGQIFHGKLKYILQDPSGFEIRSLLEKANNRFVELEFQLPTYVRFGRWRVVSSMAQKSMQTLGEVAFRVEDYVLPKFHVNVQTDDQNKPLYTVQINILAKFPRGSRVTGDLLLYCSIARDERNATSTNSQAPKKTLLLSSKIENGEWSQELNIKQCYLNDPSSRLEISAEVHEATTFRSETGSTFYEILKPGFEVIPAKPAIVRSTKKIILYIRPLTDDSSLKESEIFVNFCCISKDKNENGFQRNHSGYKLGGFLALDFDVNPNCEVHLYKIYRKLTESTLSREEIVAIPMLNDNSTLKLSWTESMDPAKILYYEGDVFEAQVTSGVRDINYIVICESRKVVASGNVPDSNRISLQIQNGMKGVCMLYVYKLENPSTKLDMLLFMAESGSCPSEYEISVSNTNVAVNTAITMKMTAANQALGLVRVMDSRLEKMFHAANNQRRHFVFNLAEFDGDNSRAKHSAILSGFINTSSLLAEIDQVCSLAGLYIVSLSPLKYPPGSSLISNLCINRILSKMLERYQFRLSGNSGQLNDSEIKQNRRISLAGVFGGQKTSFTAIEQPQNIQAKPTPAYDPGFQVNRAQENSELMPTNDFDSDEMFLRDFFPEVWLFKDFIFGQSRIVEEKLVAPHSVAEWSFVSHFWSPSRRNVCKLPSLTVFTSRHLYMDLDLPRMVYENETLKFKLRVNADKLDNELSLALCTRGFSPIACGDMGPEGKSEQNDYFFTMGPNNLRAEKEFFIRYLRDGDYDLQFELLDRSTLLNSRLTCSDSGYTHVFDKIKHTIHVSKRVDLDEHFRQKVVYRQRKPSNQVAISRQTQMISSPDVIQFTDTSFDNGTVVSSVGITSAERVYDIALEFSEFTPAVPLKDLNSFVEMRNSPRRRRQISTFGSLPDVIGDLSWLTFQPKSSINLQTNSEDLANNRDNEIAVGNLLSELLTYSDCRSAVEPKPCGFGEYGVPSSPEMRDIVLTSLATTLLCEKAAAEEFICGPVQYLAEVIPQTATSTSSFLEFLQFDVKGRDSETFLRALLSWVGRECSAYSCVQKHSVWKNFLLREYHDDFDSKDLRIEAAFAHLLPDGSASLIRQRLSEHATPTTLPFWSVKVRDQGHQSMLDTSIQRSADILLNSLAFLAYTSTPVIYSFWRQRFDFDALADWLVAQQDGRHQFENALDTYFGLKALSSYRSCQLSAASNDNINGNVSVSSQSIRSFDQDELPLKLGISSNSTSVQVTTSGELRVILGVRVMTEKRRRSKRDPSENYPVSIKLTQQRDGSSGFFKQTVTIMSHSSLLTKLEIEHGIMTAFYTEPSWVKLTSQGVSFLIEPRVRSSAVNFVISGLQRDKEFSYEIRFGEPPTSYDLDYLAPFLITAKHHVIVGQQVISPKDLDFAQVEDFSRRKRFSPMLQRLTQSTNLIETVCVENGACTCAEGTCEVTCQSCGYVKVQDLCREYKRPFGFVVVFKLVSHRQVQLDGNSFDVFDIHPYEFYGIDETKGAFSLWIRTCNTLCKRATRDAKGRFLLIGRSDGIFYSPINHSNATDTSSLHRHYLLRNEDRLAKASECYALFSEFQDGECLNTTDLV